MPETPSAGLLMPAAMFILIGCQLIGEFLRTSFALPIPGPVIGMLLLTIVLAARDGMRKPIAENISTPLERASNVLISHMGLLFVPAGVGIIAEVGVLRAQWVPIVAALLGSTLLGLLATGLVMHHASAASEKRKTTRVTNARAPETQP